MADVYDVPLPFLVRAGTQPLDRPALRKHVRKGLLITRALAKHVLRPDGWSVNLPVTA